MHITLIIVIHVTIIASVTERCRSGRFYCRPRSPLTVFIGRSSHTRQPDNFVFEEELESEPLNSAWRRCSWVLELDSPTPRQVLLRGIPRSSLQDVRQKRSISDPANCEFQLNGSVDGKCSNHTIKTISNYKLSNSVFILNPMNVRTQLTLSMDLPHENPSVGIAVTALEPGYCAQDMVLHNGKCYAVIEQQNSSLTDVMQVISNSSSAGMQLARFSSLEEIRNFVKLNYEPEFDLPLKQPMNFTKPVRIGLFYSRSSNSVFEFIDTGTGCEMKKHLKSEEFVSAAKITEGPCAALQGENSESAAIIFVNCNQSMPSLISFPENPENSTCTDCDGKIRDWIGDSKMHVLPISSQFPIVATAASAFLLLMGIILFLGFRKFQSELRSTCLRGEAAPTDDDTDSDFIKSSAAFCRPLHWDEPGSAAGATFTRPPGSRLPVAGVSDAFSCIGQGLPPPAALA